MAGPMVMSNLRIIQDCLQTCRAGGTLSAREQAGAHARGLLKLPLVRSRPAGRLRVHFLRS